ncbi:MAG: sulfotransferase domain-containing protein [Halioglobus sp.]
MTGQRATTVAELQDILSGLFTPEGVASGLAFKPGPQDIIISPFAKCGTTWMQQTIHGLRTRGSMNYGEITEVVPWIEAAADLGQSLEAAQVATPRAFKSHLPWDQIPKGGRYVCVIRDPIRALVSMYKFFEGWMMEPGAIAFEDFAYELYLARTAPAGYWHHLVSWMEQVNNPDVLLLCYEQLQADFHPQLQRISDFFGLAMDNELEKIVLHQSSLGFMQEHSTHFDDHFLRIQRNPLMGVPTDGASSKVSASGTVRPEPSAQLITDMQARWTQEVAPHIGFDRYEDLMHWFSSRHL